MRRTPTHSTYWACPLTSNRRFRITYALLACAIVAVGLTVHLQGAGLPAPARDIMGDALWAMMIAAGISAAAPQASASTRSLSALAACFAVECSQLVHTQALDRVRSTRVGHLVLGSGFDPRDFVAYTSGILLFWLIDRRLQQRRL